MKKKFLGLAVAAAISAPAMAQNVSLYGTIDASLQNITNITSGTNLSMGYIDGAISSSVLGFRGTEDLGGGLRAVFQLETDIQTNNGGMNHNGLFRRAAYAGVAGGFGEITLGLRLNPLIAANGSLMPVGGNSVSTTTSTVLGYADFYTRNAITYTSPAINGFQLQGQFGASNIADNSSGGSVTAWRLTYANGPFSAQAAAQQRKSVPYSAATLSAANPGTPANTALAVNGTLYNAAFGLIAPTSAAALAAKDALGKDSLIIGLRYKATPTLDIGVARISNSVSNTDADNTSTGTGGLAITGAGTTTKVSATQVGIGYTMSPAVLIGASMTMAESSRMTNLQARYSLSKRSTIYGQYGIANNDANNTVKFFPTAGNTGAAPGPLVNGGTSVGVRDVTQSSVGVGFIHTF